MRSVYRLQNQWATMLPGFEPVAWLLVLTRASPADPLAVGKGFPIFYFGEMAERLPPPGT